MTAPAYHVRWGVIRDLPQILPIEDASFTSCWTEEDFLTCFRQNNCITMVAVCPRTRAVIGYMVYELHRDRVVLLNFAVHPEYRRERVGAALVDKLKYKVCSHRRDFLRATVRESNLPAQLF